MLTSVAKQLGMPGLCILAQPKVANRRFALARAVSNTHTLSTPRDSMAKRAKAYVVPTMQMTQEDLHELQAGTLPCQAVWKFSAITRISLHRSD